MKVPSSKAGRYAPRGTSPTSAPAADSRPARSAAMAPSPTTRQRRPETKSDTASAGRRDMIGYHRPTMKGRKRPAKAAKPPAEVEVEVEDVERDDEPAEDLATEAAQVIDVSSDDDAAELAEVDAEVEPEVEVERKPREPGLARRDPLSAYMAELRRIPMLTRDEEHELAKKYF